MSMQRLRTSMILKMAMPGRFAFARATRLPLVGKLANRIIFNSDSMLYLPHDRVVEINRALFPGAQMFLPSAAVERFIERSSYRVIMNWCICRKASDCKDYPVELGCLFLGEGAKYIDPELARPVSKEEALAHLRRCRDAGLVHMIGHNKADSIWLGVKSHNQLMTICNCCPCCCLWKILPDTAPVIGAKVTRMPGLEVVISDKCKGCGKCRKACFLNAITIEADKAKIGCECRGCGRCALVCPASAIEVRMGDLEEAIEKIAGGVDVT